MSATASPKVSVIVPVHNTALWLDRCVESVRAQTLRDIEIILVENRSTDASPELCDAYPAADARIRVLHLAEAGLSRARNAGLAVATAPYVGFVDSDDYIEPDMFRRLYDAAVESGAQIAYGDLIYEEEGTPQPAEPAGPVTVRTPDEVLCDLLLERISASACTKLFDRTLFEGLQFPLDVWFEDHRVVHEWVARCRRIAHVEKVCYHYVQRDGSICHSFSAPKHYHFFLANFERFEFVRRQRLFEGRTRARRDLRQAGAQLPLQFPGGDAPQTCPRFRGGRRGYAPETGADVRGESAASAGDAKALAAGREALRLVLPDPFRVP